MLLHFIVALCSFFSFASSEKCVAYSYYNTSLSECRMCSQDHLGCAICKNDTECLACFGGYYLNVDTC